MDETKLIATFVFGGLQIFVHLAIVVFAVIAARRYKLAGMWLLVAAVTLDTLERTANIVMSFPMQAFQDYRKEGYFMIIGYVYSAIMLITLCGWAVLAFSRRKETKPIT